jgi:glycine cleavage system H protein
MSEPRKPFKGGIPDGLRYDAEYDMWVRREGGEVVVGATSYGIFLAGDIIGFTAKPRGAEVAAGRSLGTVECAKTVLAVHSPVSFTLDQANEALEERAAPINGDPYGAGWMARGRPAAWDVESRRLLDAAAYRAHILARDPTAEFA